MQWGINNPLSNNLSVTFPITFNQVFAISLGQGAETAMDSYYTYCDISFSSGTRSSMYLWARRGNIPAYSWIVIGN